MRKFIVVAALLGLVGFVAGCRSSCNPCAEPCAPAARPCPQPCPAPCPRPCPKPCASPCNEPNPCAQPPCVPPPGPPLTCLPNDKPCPCWPDFGSPSARALLDGIIARCDSHIADPKCEPVKQSWIVLRGKAVWAKGHACTKYTCQQYWDIVNGCHSAVVAIGDRCDPAPQCTELNHPD